MPDGQADKQTAPDAGGQTGKQSAPEEVRYDRDGWIERARQLEAQPHAIIGALSGDDRKTFTEEQVRDALDRFFDPSKTPPVEG